MNIFAIVPTYRKPESILLQTIKYLCEQTIEINRIVVVGSDESDSFVKKLGVDYIETENLPLWKKFQFGISYCKQYKPDAILICGADDWLSLNWIEILSPYLTDFDIIGSDHLYSVLLFPDNPIKIACVSYRGTPRYGEPLGPGRLIGKDLLDKMDWNLFLEMIGPKGEVINYDSRIDGSSYKRMLNFECKTYLYKDDVAKILSPKGKWRCITSWGSIFLSKATVFIDNPEIWLNINFPGSLEYLCKNLDLKIESGIIKKKYNSTNNLLNC